MSVSVTFDTNMWKRLVSEERRVKHKHADDILRVMHQFLSP